MPTERTPEYGLIYVDSMTNRTCVTPKTASNVNPVMENRVTGAYVVCGPLKRVFLYNTDNLVRGGANIIIEIVRQGIF